jgi:hypothetical protein
MPICRNCEVELEEGLSRCPLCLAPLEGEAEQGQERPPPSAAVRAAGGPSGPLTRRRLWEIVSLLAGTGAAVVLVADFAYSMTVTWARFPLVSILFLWAAATLLLYLRRHRLLLLIGETAALALFLLALDLLMPGKPWFLTLALPLSLLAGALIGAVCAAAKALRPRFFAILAVALASAGLFVLGLEAAVNLYYHTGPFRLSWSLVVFGCIAPLVGLLLYIQYRLKATRKDMRKIFHL